MKCASLSIIGEASNGSMCAFPLYCKRWSCPACAPRKKKHVRKVLTSGTPTTLLTLTSRFGSYPTVPAAFRALTVSINHLFKRIRRAYPTSNIEYALVWETTKRGWPHAHLLLRAPYIPHAFISRAWLDLTGSPVVDIRRVKSNGHVAAYVSKYLAKDPETPYGMKRWRTSRRYRDMPPPLKLREYLSIERFFSRAQPLADTVAHYRSIDIPLVEYWPELYVTARPP